MGMGEINKYHHKILLSGEQIKTTTWEFNEYHGRMGGY